MLRYLRKVRRDTSQQRDRLEPLIGYPPVTDRDQDFCCYFNNDMYAQAIDDALTLRAMVSQVAR